MQIISVYYVPKSRVTLFLSDLTLGVNESVSSSRLNADARCASEHKGLGWMPFPP